MIEASVTCRSDDKDLHGRGLNSTVQFSSRRQGPGHDTSGQLRAARVVTIQAAPVCCNLPSSEDLVHLLLLSENSILKRRIVRDCKRRIKRWLLHPINRRRRVYGEYHHLIKQLKEDPERFFLYTRMSVPTLNIILNRLKGRLEKKRIGLLQQVKPEERLLVTIRKTGEGRHHRDLRSRATIRGEINMSGLPHAHIVFKIEGDGPVRALETDSVIRAEIPSVEEAGRRLRKLVLQHMIHGPCSTEYHIDFPCWDSTKGHCTKHFPKPSWQTAHVDDRGGSNTEDAAENESSSDSDDY
ncbi:hypothetical protein J6590_097599 [Homalodisca vitripennis]|nr:hypothetical protein J6590_097599 [Homalodisca vitripennis]